MARTGGVLGRARPAGTALPRVFAAPPFARRLFRIDCARGFRRRHHPLLLPQNSAVLSRPRPANRERNPGTARIAAHGGGTITRLARRRTKLSPAARRGRSPGARPAIPLGPAQRPAPWS